MRSVAVLLRLHIKGCYASHQRGAGAKKTNTLARFGMQAKACMCYSTTGIAPVVLILFYGCAKS